MLLATLACVSLANKYVLAIIIISRDEQEQKPSQLMEVVCKTVDGGAEVSEGGKSD